MRLKRARFKPNARISAQRGADWRRAAMSFIFLPAGFREPILSTQTSRTLILISDEDKRLYFISFWDAQQPAGA